MGKWLAIIALVALLALATWVAYRQWNLVDFEMPLGAWIALGFGVVVSMLVGGGLMALMFYSSRKGYDDPPVQKKDPGAGPGQ